jgi:predicted GNAT family N-acyltransferase
MSKKTEEVAEVAVHSALNRRDLFQNYDAEGEPITEGESYVRHGVRWIGRVWVKSAFRRRGLGRALLGAMVREFQAEPLYLQVLAYDGQIMPDSELVKWYSGFGFCATDVPGILLRPAGPLILEGGAL